MGHPDLDALAEAYWAKEDPQNSEIDEDLIAQRERWESRTMTSAEHMLRFTLESFEPDELEYLASQAEYLGDWLRETLEEYI